MKSLIKHLTLASVLCSSTVALAQDSAEDEVAPQAAPASLDVKVDPTNEGENLLATWIKDSSAAVRTIPRRWLFLQEQSGSIGAPSPLVIDRSTFEGYGWFQLADADAIRLFIQINPSQKKDELKPEELSARLKRYADLTLAQGIILKTAATPSTWAMYIAGSGFDAAQVNFDKGPESLRQDLPARWLAQKLGYDAVVVGIVEDYLVLAKLRPIKRGAQGLILKKSATALVGDAEKDIGALLRVVHETDDYVLAKVSLSKSGRPKVPMGSKVLFDQP